MELAIFFRLDASAVNSAVKALDNRDAAAGIGLDTMLHSRAIQILEELGQVAVSMGIVSGHDVFGGGLSRTAEDVHVGLCNVIVAGLVALASMRGDWASFLQVQLPVATARIRQSASFSTTSPKRDDDGHIGGSG